jgi:putative hemolysin
MPDVFSRPDPFELPVPLASRLTRAAITAARPFLARALGLSELQRLYPELHHAPGATFEARALHALGVTVEAVTHEAIPQTGPLIVAANHPTGALDGLVLTELIRQRRSDVRVLANRLLERIPEVREFCFFVDPFGGADAAARSRGGLRAAHLWLRGGGALLMFPSGEVAAADGEGAWNEALGRLALATRARVLPVFLEGGNSRLFYAAGSIHPRLRTALLGRELLNKRGTTVRVFVGRALDAPDLSHARTAAAVTGLVRGAMDGLRVGRPVDAALLVRDVAALPEGARLVSSGNLAVYCAASGSLPHVLREIGRLREVTFRSVGEGTGRAIDLDRFDEHYEHLFVWNHESREVVAAYRVGRTDRILRTHGIEGLYTRTLFRYDERLLERTGPAFELGRSFVRAEYQRSSSALLLLWKGIGRLLAAAPQCRVLFGAVSISSRYQDMSQRLLRAFLVQNHLDRDLEPLVAAVHPPSRLSAPPRGSAAIADVGELDSLIKRVEGSQGIPVLLRQYLRLNATLLGFNVDPAFGDALDALMMVDIRRIPIPLRLRYLGRIDSARAA